MLGLQVYLLCPSLTQDLRPRAYLNLEILLVRNELPSTYYPIYVHFSKLAAHSCCFEYLNIVFLVFIKLQSLFLYMCMYLYELICTMRVQVPLEVIGFLVPETIVTGICEPDE